MSLVVNHNKIHFATLDSIYFNFLFKFSTGFGSHKRTGVTNITHLQRIEQTHESESYGDIRRGWIKG